MASSSSTTTISPLAPIVSVDDFQRHARLKLPHALYEYLASGTDQEQTLRENRTAFQQWYLRPRMLRPVHTLSTRQSLFGFEASMPVFLSPAGVHALFDADGECATARACAEVGILFGLSQHATRSIEDVARAVANSSSNSSSSSSTPSRSPRRGDGACLWYQAYLLRDRQRTLALIQRALKAGYRGIFLTVDSVRFGYREADARNGFNALPPPHRLVHYDDHYQSTTYNSQTHAAWDQNTEQMFAQDLSWEDVRWLKQTVCAHVPLVIKGILTGEDAELAIAAGADGVMVSNHGGRQLDGALASIDALPEVVRAVRGRVPVWLDGGVRRGTDVVKALALGASAVGLGKPFFFALAVNGQAGVSQMLQLLRTEIEAAMALCGVAEVSEITRALVQRHPMHYTNSAVGPRQVPQFRSSL